VDKRRGLIEDRLSKVGKIAGDVLENQDNEGLVLGEVDSSNDE